MPLGTPEDNEAAREAEFFGAKVSHESPVVHRIYGELNNVLGASTEFDAIIGADSEWQTEAERWAGELIASHERFAKLEAARGFPVDPEATDEPASIEDIWKTSNLRQDILSVARLPLKAGTAAIKAFTWVGAKPGYYERDGR